jgi:integrase/recombinase XerD
MPEHHRGRRPANAGMTFKKDALTRPECEALLGAFSRRGSAGIRNAAMTALSINAGPRLGEMIKAPYGDLDLTAGTFYVRFPKRDRHGNAYPRTVGLNAEACALLERWVARRRQLGIGPRSLLFCQVQEPCRGEPMHPSGYREALKVAAGKAGVERRVHPHMLRHTFAYLWLKERGHEDPNLLKLMRALGHRNLATTHIYVNHVLGVEVLEAMRAPVAAPAAAPDLMAMIRQAIGEALGIQAA